MGSRESTSVSRSVLAAVVAWTVVLAGCGSVSPTQDGTPTPIVDQRNTPTSVQTTVGPGTEETLTGTTPTATDRQDGGTTEAGGKGDASETGDDAKTAAPAGGEDGDGDSDDGDDETPDETDANTGTDEDRGEKKGHDKKGKGDEKGGKDDEKGGKDDEKGGKGE